ncbi:MAG: hypothetical protein KJP18_06605 [Gemmatimonadetes bacterium]|nr:hypothetical protein [Gemmatimonadota bacterium]NNK62801.1 hypothetical protein [Gemmatimonadota bacterium]
MSERKPYHQALQEAAHHVVCAVLAPELPRRDATLPPPHPSAVDDVLEDHATPGHTRVETLARFAGPATVRLGARIDDIDGLGDHARGIALLESLGETDRRDVYAREAEGFVRVHFLTIRALALQLLQAGVLDATETGLIIEVAEGRAPLRELEAYRARAEVDPAVG